jgi:serine/threonine protein kinase/tetratricopeptide (TPR) repeat protein
MTTPSDLPRPAPLSREEAEALAARLAEEMIQRWRQGERVLPEDLLGGHPALLEHPEAAADLIYEELCLRQAHDAEVPAEQVLARFPQWRPQLEVLLDCQKLLGPSLAPPQFPAAGESLGDFLLLAELGAGAQGRVFLANQVSLGGRPVVLKVTPADAREHLALARLQHTHIVPLYSVQDHPARGLRALCMPYFGGATLARLLDALQSQPPGQRTGRRLVEAVDRISETLQIANCKLQIANCKTPAPSRQFLARVSYVEAVCWVGACLADALQYAHERGLVHLDLKPSNVLLAADGTPMLLDFHLAREPIRPAGDGRADERLASPSFLGGTAGYMSPEHHAALVAVQHWRPVTQPVDGRSDVYSLGVVLYEALFRTECRGRKTECPLLCPQSSVLSTDEVSVGLADVIGKCLAHDPNERYPTMAALAADLRRHLADRPLLGVRNRSPAERWRKWRRRRPHGVALAAMALAVFLAATAVALGAVSHFTRAAREARAALTDGQRQMAKGDWEEAVATLERGRSAARGLFWRADLADELDRQLRVAEQGRAAAKRAAAARELRRLADRVRFLYGADHLPADDLRRLAAPCRAFWESRGRIVARLSLGGPAALAASVREDLLDVAIFWADLQVRLAAPAETDEARRRARAVLAQAEDLFGRNPVLYAEGERHGAVRARSQGQPVRPSAWDHCALGRCFLRAGDLEGAAREVERAVRLRPQGLWPNFYQGVCAYRRGRYVDAVTAFSVCVGAAPGAAHCFYNRALAYAALGRTDEALRDYAGALRRDPALAGAAFDRGILRSRGGHPLGVLRHGSPPHGRTPRRP